MACLLSLDCQIRRERWGVERCHIEKRYISRTAG